MISGNCSTDVLMWSVVHAFHNVSVVDVATFAGVMISYGVTVVY